MPSSSRGIFFAAMLMRRYNGQSMASADRINYFAETDYRGKKIKFGIKEGDRARHMYIIGKTGMGKSTLLENLAVQDILAGEGLCFIDPHGSSAEMLLAYVPKHRIADVVYFAPFDQEFPLALNVMEDIGKDKRALVASGLIGAFKKVWIDAWSPRMEYILNNALLALLETPGSTLLGVNRMFADKAYRDFIIANVTDPAVRAFWLDEYAKYSDRFATEATAAIQNKVGQFVANPLIRNIIGQPKSTFDIRELMDGKKIFIVNLSKGRIGEGNANLIGSMLITKIYLAAMSRAEIHPTELHKFPAFYLYVDEFQSFANESFADILSEARKYKLSLTIAHQYIEQMSEEVRAAVFGNVGTMIAFRVGSYDAEVLEKEFAPQFTAQDIVNLGFAQIYLKLMIDGVGSPPFSATTLPRPVIPEPNFVKEVIDHSRRQFGRPRADVEADILKWHEPIPGSPEGVVIPKTRKYAPGDQPFQPKASSRNIATASSDARPAERRQAGAVSARSRNEETHRPFAEGLAQALQELKSSNANDREMMGEEPAEYGEEERKAGRSKPTIAEIQSSLPRQSPQRSPSASLSSLQNSPNRKDKGITPGRLSDLRAALEKALKQSGGQEQHLPPESADVPREYDTEPSPASVSRPRLAGSREAAPSGKEERVVSQQQGKTAPTPKQNVLARPTSTQFSRSLADGPLYQQTESYEQTLSHYDAPMEIPEDVLRRVLRLD